MAESNFMTTVDALFKGLDTFVSSKTVVGEPIKVDDATIIPIMDVTCGMAAGTYAESAVAKGSGGMGAKMSPVAMLIIQNGAVRLINVKNQDAVTKVMDMVPSFIDRLKSKKVTDSAVASAEAVAKEAVPVVQTAERLEPAKTPVKAK